MKKEQFYELEIYITPDGQNACVNICRVNVEEIGTKTIYEWPREGGYRETSYYLTLAELLRELNGWYLSGGWSEFTIFGRLGNDI